MDRLGGKLALCVTNKVKGSYWILPEAHDLWARKNIKTKRLVEPQFVRSWEEARARPRSSAPIPKENLVLSLGMFGF